MADSDSGGGFAAGFLAGSIVGVVVGILIAPKSGSETRAELGVRSDAWRSRAEELAAQLRERAGPAMEGMRERVSPAVESVRERVGPVVDQVNARIGRGQPARESEDEQEPAVAVASTDKTEGSA